MKTGAVIAAAGIPVNMPDFDPTIMLGDTSVIKKIIITLQKAGVDPIVVVTGYKAEVLEKHVAQMGVVFLRNPDYMRCDMFQTVLIGLEYLKEECEQVFVMPADVPLFSSESLSLLMSGDGMAVCPVHDGVTGHPILLKKELFEGILKYRFQGDDGLKGAIDFGGYEAEFVDVDDEGILLELDSRDDLDRLLQASAERTAPLRYSIQLKLGRNELVFGPAILQFLELVNRTNSMQTACKQMHVSYSKGLRMINLAEKETGIPLLERHAGGSEGGVSFLTPAGKEFLCGYNCMKGELEIYARKLFEQYFGRI